MNFLISLLVSGLVVLGTSHLVAGVHCDGILTAVGVGLVYSVLIQFLAIPAMLAATPPAIVAAFAAPIAGPVLVVTVAVFLTAGASLLVADWLFAGFWVSGMSGAVVAAMCMAVLKAILAGLGLYKLR